MDSALTMIDSPTFGRFVFDAVFSTEHSSNVNVTMHPVQTGASVADHSYVEPYEVTIEIGMSDAAVGVDSEHSVNAYTQLLAIMEAREPVTLVSRLKTYQSMVITSISTTDDYKTMHGLRATIYFTQIKIVDVSVVRVQETTAASKGSSSSSSKSSGSSKKSSSKTSSKKSTTKSTQKKESVLHGLLG